MPSRSSRSLAFLVRHSAFHTMDHAWEMEDEIFDRPFPEPLPRWDDENADGTDFWATSQETRYEIVEFSAASASTPTRPSAPSPSTPPVMCRGGRATRAAERAV
jgi:hypothetical protein